MEIQPTRFIYLSNPLLIVEVESADIVLYRSLTNGLPKRSRDGCQDLRGETDAAAIGPGTFHKGWLAVEGVAKEAGEEVVLVKIRETVGAGVWERNATEGASGDGTAVPSKGGHTGGGVDVNSSAHFGDTANGFGPATATSIREGSGTPEA